MGYILLLDNNKSWTVEPVAFQGFLNRSFHIESFKEIADTSRPYSHEWKISQPINIEGFLHKSGDSIHFDGAFQDCIDFVLTVRNFIPSSERLIFFDDSYNYNTVIDSSTTKQNLIDVFSH
jgi:hypothetical protein